MLPIQPNSSIQFNSSVSRNPEPVVIVTVTGTVMVIRFDKASRAPYSRFLLLRLGTKRAWPDESSRRIITRSQVDYIGMDG